jgi:hypothetical protein
MRTFSGLALASVVLIAGCQSTNGSVDWRRTAMVAGKTVVAGGGLLLGGPAGAAAGLEVGSGIFSESASGVRLFGSASARATRPRMAQPVAKQPRPAPTDTPVIASPSPHEAETTTPAAIVPARTSVRYEEVESLGI